MTAMCASAFELEGNQSPVGRVRRLLPLPERHPGDCRRDEPAVHPAAADGRRAALVNMASPYDILIIGGGVGGVAAAIAAARSGRPVGSCLTEGNGLDRRAVDFAGRAARRASVDRAVWLYEGVPRISERRSGLLSAQLSLLTDGAGAMELLNPGDGSRPASVMSRESPLPFWKRCLRRIFPADKSRYFFAMSPIACTDGGGFCYVCCAAKPGNRSGARVFAALVHPGRYRDRDDPAAGGGGIRRRSRVPRRHRRAACRGRSRPARQSAERHPLLRPLLSRRRRSRSRTARAIRFLAHLSGPFWPGPHLGWSDLHPTTRKPGCSRCSALPTIPPNS